MMTQENWATIKRFLGEKRLPLDLYLEVLDHITEQIQSLMIHEQRDFPTAFRIVKTAWQEDLKFKKNILPWRRKITILENNAINTVHRKFLLKVLYWYIIPFITCLLLMRYDEDLGYYSWMMMHVIFVLMGVYYIITKWKLVNNSRRNHRKRLSFTEAGVGLLLLGTIYQPMLVTTLPRRYEKLLAQLMDFHFNFEITIDFIIHFITFFAWNYITIVGILYLKEYSKSVETINRRLKADF